MQDARSAPPPPRSNRRFLRLFENPWIGFIGSVASVIGLLLAIYFYRAGTSHPELVYCMNPARAVVVKQGTASRLAVQFEGRSLTEDVTAVQIALWNRGRSAIHSSAVRQPVTIRTGPSNPILEATVRKTSREVVLLSLDQARLAQGEVSVYWNVLEHLDGGVLQLVYSGGPNIPIAATGVIEGQAAIHESRYPGVIANTTSAQVSWSRRNALLYYSGGLLLCCLLLASITLRNVSQRGWSRRRIFDLVMPFLVAGISLLGTLDWWWYDPPPFGF